MSLLSDLLHPPASVGRRVLLVGTARTVRQSRCWIREAAGPVECVGCVLVRAVPQVGAVGMRTLGTIEELARVVRLHRVELVVAALPAAMDELAGRVRRTCESIGVTLRMAPSVDDLLAGRMSAAAPRGLHGLIDRPRRRLDERAIGKLLTGRRVLITGAGGSIGSELAAIIARYGPAELQLMERAENNLFEVTRVLQQRHPSVAIRPLLHDVTLADRTLALCRQLLPNIVFHAAAHKHVPMMEDHPREAVENNVFGTKAIADAAHAVGVDRFVMISSDKAVNPSSVMGATKRLAELYIQHLNRSSRTAFAMVRFGNVLGSACSVIPIWTQQLAEGGPITVTDPRMTRYFMTIEEAAGLVIQAGSLPDVAGRILLLDMGEPIRIVDMARRFIEMHGLEAERDVSIAFTGVRPGEKLFEELVYDGEAMQPTAHPSVRIWRSAPPDASRMVGVLGSLTALRQSHDRRALVQALHDAVPEMRAAAVAVDAAAESSQVEPAEPAIAQPA